MEQPRPYRVKPPVSRTILPIIVVASVLSGCGQQPAATAETAIESNVASATAEAPGGNAALPDEAPVAPAPRNPAAGPAGADDYSWIAFRSGGGQGFPVLIYGAGSSDELVINFQCRERGQVTALQMRDSLGISRSEPITLASGRQRLSLDVTLGPDSADGSTSAAAALPPRHPLLQSFRSTGQLTVTTGSRATAANAVADSERSAIESFFKTCGL